MILTTKNGAFTCRQVFDATLGPALWEIQQPGQLGAHDATCRFGWFEMDPPRIKTHIKPI